MFPKMTKPQPKTCLQSNTDNMTDFEYRSFGRSHTFLSSALNLLRESIDLRKG